MDKNHIIDITAVVFYFQLFSREMIELVQIDVAKELAGQIADGKAFVFLGKEQAFGFGQAHPIFAFAFHAAVSGRVVEYDDTEKIEHESNVKGRVFYFPQPPFDFLIQNIPVHGHEIAFDVQLQDPAIFLIVFRGCADEMADPPDAERRAFPQAAGVAVAEEMFFKKRVDVIENQMVDDAIAKIGGKDLPPDGLFGDETSAGTDRVGAPLYLVKKREQVFFVVQFELEGVDGFSFVLPGVIIGPEEV